MKISRVIAFIIIFAMLVPLCVLADNSFINRGEVADMLLLAADYYNPSLVRSDIIKGYEDGLLHEERNVTRAEALIMLKRAFGTLPVPTGHNKRVALSSEDFTDIPQWAQSELESVFDSGIAAGTAKGIFTPDANVTKEQMELFIKRVYALYGTNPKDDFYAAVNKEALEKLPILSGNVTAGTLVGMQMDATTKVNDIILGLSSQNNKVGTKEQKIADFYKCITDIHSRNDEGINPIRPYLEKIDSIKNITELTHMHELLSSELCVNPFISFSLTVDLEDSTKYMLLLETLKPFVNKEVYLEGEKKEAYINYLKELLIISGEEEEEAAENAQAYFKLEKALAEKKLGIEEEQNIEKLYSVNSFNKISRMFPDFDLEGLLSNFAMKKDERVLVKDMSLVQEFSSFYNQANLSVLKTAMKLSLIIAVKDTLSEDFISAQRKLDRVILGTDDKSDLRRIAVDVLKKEMPEYLGQLYGEKYFDKEVKEDIYSMTKDIIGVFKKRIDALSWMDTETKEKAKKKLDNIKIKIGYPDFNETHLDSVDIIPPSSGGTYFGNMIAIKKASVKHYGSLQSAPVNHDAWRMEPYTVNASYNPSSNDIILPAAILAQPLYNKNASYEENLGGIGFIIAHEITHAFDSVGAKFDEKGNLNDWWRDRDYKAFQELCEKVATFFDGEESIAAIRNNGRLTLNENIADLGAAACITQLLEEKGDPDFKKLYEAIAKIWMSTSTREYALYSSETDNHSDGKLRVNRVLVNIKEFYEAFDIGENDGMYVRPEERILIW